jgi:hypothetical protein
MKKHNVQLEGTQMELLANPRFSGMVIFLAITVFSITLNGHLRRNMGDALFGFLGLSWLVISIVVFVVFGWKIGILCMTGSYLFSMIASPVSGMIATFLRRDTSH